MVKVIPNWNVQITFDNVPEKVIDLRVSGESEKEVFDVLSKMLWFPRTVTKVCIAKEKI